MNRSMKYSSKGPASKGKREVTRVHVLPTKGGWAVKKGSAKATSALYQTKAGATKAARDSLRNEGSGELVIHGRDGRIRQNFSVSRGDFEKVSAVEGLYLSAEMKRDFDEFDRLGHSDGQRRKTIMKKYSKPRV